MNIICIYTHAGDIDALNKFKSSTIYKTIKECNEFKILEVFGNEIFNKPVYDGNKLIVDCEEEYSALSVKTFKMIKSCVDNFDFDNIIKIDANILDYSKRKNLFLSKSCLRRFYSDHKIKSIIFQNSYKSYFGTHLIRYVSEESFKIWADNKNIKNINYNKEFLGDDFPSFYTGKLYGLSYNFAKFIAKTGEYTAYNHKKNLGGAEDVFVGRMFSKFYRKDWIYDKDWVADCIDSVQNC